MILLVQPLIFSMTKEYLISLLLILITLQDYNIEISLMLQCNAH